MFVGVDCGRGLFDDVVVVMLLFAADAVAVVVVCCRCCCCRMVLFAVGELICLLLWLFGVWCVGRRCRCCCV